MTRRITLLANRWVRPRGRLRYTVAVARELPVFRPVPFVLELDGRAARPHHPLT